MAGQDTSKAAKQQSRPVSIPALSPSQESLPPKLTTSPPPKKPFRFHIPEPSPAAANAPSPSKASTKPTEPTTVLVGPNGAGKSTLLKILAGNLEFQKGTRNLGHNAVIGYFSQYRADTLNPYASVLDEVLASNGELREDDARGILGSFLFRKDDIYKKTKVLSGGEKSRLNLIKFLVNPPNLLLMDEPTTHLDIHTVESPILALEAYAGMLVFISHDVHFIRKLTNRVIHVNNGTINISRDGGNPQPTSGQVLQRQAMVYVSGGKLPE